MVSPWLGKPGGAEKQEAKSMLSILMGVFPLRDLEDIGIQDSYDGMEGFLYLVKFGVLEEVNILLWRGKKTEDGGQSQQN
jgi:hypothetical protein